MPRKRDANTNDFKLNMELTEDDLEDPYKSSSKWATRMFDATWPHKHNRDFKQIRMEEVEQLLNEPWTMEDYRKLMGWYAVDYSWGMRGNSVRKRTRLRQQEVNDIILVYCKEYMTRAMGELAESLVKIDEVKELLN